MIIYVDQNDERKRLVGFSFAFIVFLMAASSKKQYCSILNKIWILLFVMFKSLQGSDLLLFYYYCYLLHYLMVLWNWNPCYSFVYGAPLFNACLCIWSVTLFVFYCIHVTGKKKKKEAGILTIEL